MSEVIGSNDGRPRCGWSLGSESEMKYHDQEWGVPRIDDLGQFEFLVLESAQAGLSWTTILNKRAGYRRAFEGFDPLKVAQFTAADVERLLLDASIVRNRKKIESAIGNARIFLDLAAKHGSFSRYLWGFIDGRPIQNQWRSLSQIPAMTPLSDLLAKEFKRLGFKFMGSTILYAHLQATGLVNDHLVDCFRHDQVRQLAQEPKFVKWSGA